MKKESMKKESEIMADIDSTLATILIKDLGCTQERVAKLLYKTPPAISQYMSATRGDNTGFSDDVHNEIRKLADLVNVKNGLPQNDLIKHRFEVLLYFKEHNEHETQN